MQHIILKKHKCIIYIYVYITKYIIFSRYVQHNVENIHIVTCSHCNAILCAQEKRAAAAKAQQLQQPQVGSGSTPASGAASPSPMETTPSGGVDRASSDAVAVAAAAMARTKSQGKADEIIAVVSANAIIIVFASVAVDVVTLLKSLCQLFIKQGSFLSITNDEPVSTHAQQPKYLLYIPLVPNR